VDHRLKGKKVLIAVSPETARLRLVRTFDCNRLTLKEVHGENVHR
jgi:hypothetical protein